VINQGGFTSPDGDEFTAYRVPFRPGGTFSVWFSLILDRGPGITITHIGWPPRAGDSLPIARVQVQPWGTLGTSPRTLTPFRPFSLGPGVEVDVLATIRMRGCEPAHSSLGFGSMPVTYRFLGITQHTTVFLPESIEVVGPTGVLECPPAW
jgi:hypothetical protein